IEIIGIARDRGTACAPRVVAADRRGNAPSIPEGWQVPNPRLRSEVFATSHDVYRIDRDTVDPRCSRLAFRRRTGTTGELVVTYPSTMFDETLRTIITYAVEPAPQLLNGPTWLTFADKSSVTLD